MTPAAILYFIPDVGQSGIFGKAWLSALPEDRRARFEASNTHRDNAPGPGNRRGLLVTWQTNVLLDYDPNTQTWQQIGPNLWCGIRNDYKPEEFERPGPAKEKLSGYLVELGDGNRWRIPVALADSPNFAMPWRERYNELGEIVRQVSEPYQTVCQLADSLWAHISGREECQMAEDAVREACAVAISVHYDLDLQDCVALGLFTTESYQLIVSSILDVPCIARIKSGEARAPSDTDSGGADSSETTSQPTPTSQS